jgi:hypothetical protein
VRGEGETHECLNDAKATMELVLAKLQGSFNHPIKVAIVIYSPFYHYSSILLDFFLFNYFGKIQRGGIGNKEDSFSYHADSTFHDFFPEMVVG